MSQWGAKDPDDVADYWFNWAGVLSSGVTIVSHEIVYIIPNSEFPVDPVLVDEEDHTIDKVRVRLSGGTHDTAYDVRCKVVTSTDETFYATQVLPVKERKQ